MVAKATFFGVLFIRQLKLTAMDNYPLQLASAKLMFGSNVSFVLHFLSFITKNQRNRIIQLMLSAVSR